LGHGESKPLGIIGVLAVIETEGLFVYIAKQMKRLNSNVGFRARCASTGSRSFPARL
jgi:hypothetical protein